MGAQGRDRSLTVPVLNRRGSHKGSPFFFRSQMLYSLTVTNENGSSDTGLGT